MRARWLLAAPRAVVVSVARPADGPVIGASGDPRLMSRNIATVGARPAADLQIFGRHDATIEVTPALAVVGRIRLAPITARHPAGSFTHP